MHVHLGDRQHHRAGGSPPALQRLRVERLVGIPGLGDVDGHRPGRRVERLGLVAVGIAAPFGAALVQPGAEEALPLQAHGEIEQGGEDLAHALGTGRDELLQESSDDRALRFRHSGLLWGDGGHRDECSTSRKVSPTAEARQFRLQNFQTSGYTAVGYTIISIAVFDVAKYLLEEEAIRAREMRHAGEARRSLTKFISTIAIAVFLEALVSVFEAAKQDMRMMLYPTLLLFGGISLVVGLGVYQRLSASV